MPNLVYLNLKNRIKSRVHNPNLDADDLSLWVNAARDRLIRTIKPSFLMDSTNFTAVVDQATYYLANIDPTSITDMVNETLDRQLYEVLETNLNSFDADRSNESSPVYYVVGDMEYIQAQPSAASVIALSSSAVGDTSASVLVKGIVGGLEVSEVVTLNALDATTPVNSTNTYTSLLSISVATVLTGSLTATSNATVITNVTIPIGYHYTQYTPITLWGTPTETDVYRIHHTKTITQLTHDADPLGVPDEWASLLFNLSIVEAHRHGYEVEVSEFLLNHIEQDIFFFQSLYKSSRRKRNSMVRDHSFGNPFDRFDHSSDLG